MLGINSERCFNIEKNRMSETYGKLFMFKLLNSQSFNMGNLGIYCSLICYLKHSINNTEILLNKFEHNI